MNPIRLRVTKPGASLPIYEVMLDPNGPMELGVGERGQLCVPGAELGIAPPYKIELFVLRPTGKAGADGK
jgi:hypothetical protein